MLKVIFVIIGTLIGAGFASGREIYVFFTQYGKMGLLGIIITGIITGVIIYRVLTIVKTYEIFNYNKLLERINWKYQRTNKLINFIVNSFLLISFYIMVAGFSAYLNQSYRVNSYLSSTLFAIICYLIFKKNIEGVIKVNEILVPILLIFIIFLGIKNLPFIITKKDLIQTATNSNYFLISSLLYASYNSIVLIPVLTGLRNYLTNKKQIIRISIICSFTIVLLAALIYALLLRDTFFISQLEMPLIEITMQFGKAFKYIYGFVIIASIFTSAISTGYSFLKNITKSKDGYNAALLLICISSIFISNIGFSKLVETLYPIFGLLGLIQIFLLFR